MVDSWHLNYDVQCTYSGDTSKFLAGITAAKKQLDAVAEQLRCHVPLSDGNRRERRKLAAMRPRPQKGRRK